MSEDLVLNVKRKLIPFRFELIADFYDPVHRKYDLNDIWCQSHNGFAQKELMGCRLEPRLDEPQSLIVCSAAIQTVAAERGDALVA